MDKKTFDEYEAICKKGWQSLAMTGGNDKPSYFDAYNNECPACHLTTKTHGNDDFNCKFCPVDEWRQNSKRDPTLGVCIQRDELFNLWVYSSSMNTRKKVASKISKLKWTFLPFHKKLKL